MYTNHDFDFRQTAQSTSKGIKEVSFLLRFSKKTKTKKHKTETIRIHHLNHYHYQWFLSGTYFFFNQCSSNFGTLSRFLFAT